MNSRTRISVVVAVALIVGLLGVALAACGDDPWTGTWKSTTVGLVAQDDGSTKPNRTTFTIAPDDGGWTVTDGIGNTTPCREVDGRLVPEDERNAAWFELRDDRLVYVDADGTVLGEFTKE